MEPSLSLFKYISDCDRILYIGKSFVAKMVTNLKQFGIFTAAAVMASQGFSFWFACFLRWPRCQSGSLQVKGQK